MRISLIAPPWYALHLPAISIGILAAALSQETLGHDIRQRYANIEWAERLIESGIDGPGSEFYRMISEDHGEQGLGDWIFTSALYDRSRWRFETYAPYLKQYDAPPESILRTHEMAPAFVDEVVSSILVEEPDLVGFTTTFAQNVSSLALACALKARRPQVDIVFGGANCDGVQGVALQRNFPFIDYVVRGEGERPLVALVRAIAADQESASTSVGLADIPGLCWWRDGRQEVNAEATGPVPTMQVLSPDIDAYFNRLADSPLSGWINPRISIESSRGCWWGQKHHCTFCGLNGSLLDFRAVPGDAFLTEIERQLRRHQVLDIITADNILPRDYFNTVLPALAARGWDLDFACEIKSNMSAAQIETLGAAGGQAQPGIESLDSDVLRLMNKGVSGAQNVETLRNCESAGVYAAWNYLYGFPGERDEHYRRIIAQMPALVHLRPPVSSTRILLERFSPNFERRAELFAWSHPAKFYSAIYDLPPDELADMVYLYDCSPEGITEQVATELRSAIRQWRDDYEASSLSMRDSDGIIVIRDRRRGWSERDVTLSDPIEAALYRLLSHNIAPRGIEMGLSDLRLTTNLDWIDCK